MNMIKKIRYLIIIIPVLIIMLFSQPNVKGFDFQNHKPENNDLFYIIDIDTEWEIAYLGYVSSNRPDSIVYTVVGNQYLDITLNNVGDMVVYNDNAFTLANPLNLGILTPGDILSVVYEGFLSNGVDTIILGNSSLDVYFTYRKDMLPGASYYVVDINGDIGLSEIDFELYDFAYNQGKNEMIDYYESIIPYLLDDEYVRGYDDGYWAYYEDISGGISSWVINSSLKVNEELYNYIDYDNLVYYENVGQLVITDNDFNRFLDIETYENVVAMEVYKPENYIGYDTNNRNNDFNIDGFEHISVISNLYKTPFTVGNYLYTNRFLFMFPDTFTEENAKNYLRGKTITYELAEKQQTQITELELNQLPFYHMGYMTGLKDSMGDTQGFTGILFSIFGGFTSFFAIELLPNITIGALVLIPIVFGIIAFIIGRRKE